MAKSGFKSGSGQFEGKFLVAMPGLASSFFAQTIIYVCAHNEEGAMGFVVNKTRDMTFCDLVEQTDVFSETAIPQMPTSVAHAPVCHGGPVDEHRGFVLHSTDYCGDSTIPISDSVFLTSTTQVLRMIANGHGPHRCVISLGYSGWGPGQLETEMMDNSWLTLEADPGLVFDRDHDTKYDRLLRAAGIQPEHFVADCGHA
ncbi:YqgE/AlgH family protein [Oricola sp.]|uniref:YqgE/AlgH family protein n=1 Tax=Oricola sp. TaxID=1979950 RepID=UPI0025E4704B|nr:YqgE/AlgH family protein [Oricola sp.]